MWYLTAAFAALWFVVTAYVFFVATRQRKLESELTSLEESLSERNRRAA